MKKIEPHTEPNITPIDSVIGTTSTPRAIEEKNKKQPKQRLSWFFTFNNYEKEDPKILCDKFNEICEKFIFQKEKGNGTFMTGEEGTEIQITEGTHHLQGVIFLKKKMRPTEFKLSNKIHWEGTRNKKASINYCQKMSTAQGEIYYKGITLNRNEVDIIKDLFKWQNELLDIIDSKPNDRTIHFIYDEKGFNGKTQLVKKLLVERENEVILLDNASVREINCNVHFFFKDADGKKIENRKLKCIFFNFPKAFNINKLNCQMLENLKDGITVNTKYKGGHCVFNSPHVIIFTNSKPTKKILEKLTADKWKIGEVKGKDDNIEWKNTNDFLKEEDD